MAPSMKPLTVPHHPTKSEKNSGGRFQARTHRPVSPRCQGRLPDWRWVVGGGQLQPLLAWRCGSAARGGDVYGGWGVDQVCTFIPVMEG